MCNLLQVILYYRSAIDSAENELLELIDYAYRKCVRLLENCRVKKVELTYKERLDSTPLQDFER